MSNETQYTYSTQVTVVSGTANAASNAFVSSAEVTSVSSTQTNNYPIADLALFASFSTSVSSASNLVNVYRRDLNIDSTNDAPIPQSAAPAYSNTWVGQFVIPPYTAGSSGYFSLPNVPVTQQCEFYIENKTNATMMSGYTVKLTPKTFRPAP